MKLITSEKIFNRFATNEVVTVEGEASLYERIMPWLEESERWLANTLLGEDALNEIATQASSLFASACGAVAFGALRLAIPHLDLILTPNGFGVVNTANVVPASKERVERLIISCEASQLLFMEQLLMGLRGVKPWQESAQFAWLTSSLLQLPSDAVPIKQPGMWQRFMEAREKSAPIEAEFEELYFGAELMKRLRRVLALPHLDSPLALIVASQLRASLLRRIYPVQGACTHGDDDLVRLVNFVRSRAAEFPEWKRSPVARLYDEPAVFKNKKKSQGFWF